MAIGIFAAILIIILTIASFAVGSSIGEKKPAAAGMAFLIGFALMISFIFVPFSFHTVDSGEVAVVKHLGRIEEVKPAGTHFDLWITNKYIKYDTKIQDFEIYTAAYSSDAQPMEIAMTIQYQIMGEKVIEIATQYGNLDILQNRIESVAIERVKAVLSSHKAMDIIANRGTISLDVETAIKETIGDEYYVNITTVVLDNIDFSDAFEMAVEEKMIAEQNKLKTDYENQTRVAAAEAEIDIARAEAEAIMVVAQAQAEANKILDESITDSIIEKALVDAWDGHLPAVVGNGNYMLPNDILD